uniref:Plasminogen receptor (KT) n=1 Tax=Elaeophora elaphi TaxID=1147741 RepID=A0A0R3S116_9BILA
MNKESMVNTIRLLENQKVEREIAFQEALDERKRALELAKLQYAYPYKAVASIAVTLISGVSTYRHKNLLYLIPVAIALPYLAYETDASLGRNTERIKRRADLLYRKRLAEHEPHILMADIKHRLKELQGGSDVE